MATAGGFYSRGHPLVTAPEPPRAIHVIVWFLCPCPSFPSRIALLVNLPGERLDLKVSMSLLMPLMHDGKINTLLLKHRQKSTATHELWWTEWKGLIVGFALFTQPSLLSYIQSLWNWWFIAEVPAVKQWLDVSAKGSPWSRHITFCKYNLLTGRRRSRQPRNLPAAHVCYLC